VILPDTSIWIDAFRGREPAASTLDRLLGEGEILACGPILAELLAGTPRERRDELWLAVGSLPLAEVDYGAWGEAGERSYDLRGQGLSIPLMDVLIAVVSVRAGARLWTRDEDFDRIARAFPALELYEPV
jgi:hypothetical protein